MNLRIGRVTRDWMDRKEYSDSDDGDGDGTSWKEGRGRGDIYLYLLRYGWKRM